MRQRLLMLLMFAAVLIHAAETEIKYLSGTGSDAAVDWEFTVTGGRKAGENTTIPVPSNWELQGFGSYNYGHDVPKADETGIYTYQFEVPETWKNKRIFIVFEGAMTDTEVEINGQSAGPVHQGGFYRFEYDITDLIQFDQKNQLKAAVHKMSANESVNQAERKADYWVFGGIYRPVYLKAVPKEYIDWTAIDANADGHFQGHLHLQGIEKADHIAGQIIGMDGRALGPVFSRKITDKSTVMLSARVEGQKLWTAETPNLYWVDLSLMDGKKVIHTVRERFGFRTFELHEGQGLFLNGKQIVLKGCDRHSFWPSTGRALSRNRCLDDVLTLKEMNMNAVRMSHYPPDTWFLDLCDEYGLYVLDELAGWQKPPYDTAIGRRLIKQIVKRDVNHPSILFWDNGNEGGWNTEVDDEWAKYDPQNRPVLHPWETFRGIDTDHYESYESTVKKMEAGRVFMPTEYLHGLYDGGHGAGLDDYWKAMWGHSVTGGLFLWVYADEAVVRTDQNGRLDTDGNHAPDGIVGPYHEREASFYTIQEIWNPVYIETDTGLPADFNGRISVENRYDFTNLKTCTFEWALKTFARSGQRPSEGRILSTGVVQGPDLPPRASGVVDLKLGNRLKEAEQLILTVKDQKLRALHTYSWQLVQPQDLFEKMVVRTGGRPVIKKRKAVYEIEAGNYTFYLNRKSGLLNRVKQGAHQIPFGQGPVAAHGRKDEQSENCDIDVQKNDASIALKVTGHSEFSQLNWTVYGSGWLQLDYVYSADGEYQTAGISFDYPEKRMKGMTWLGKGPYRVWKNREKGGRPDVWYMPYKSFAPNTAWDYPEFTGYFADVSWVEFDTEDGPITLMIADPNTYLRTYCQPDGKDPRYTKMVWPEGDISILNCIPAIGTKFKPAEAYGPQSQKTVLKGNQGGTVWFYFGKIDETVKKQPTEDTEKTEGKSV